MYEGGISIETYSAGAGIDVASMVDKHLKCTATLPLYITSESAISRMNFFALLLPRFYEIPIFVFPCSSSLFVKTFPLMYQLQMQEKAKVISARQHILTLTILTKLW